MFDPNSTKRWYGVLQTPSSYSRVIHDPALPAAPKGQVFLFNMERDSVIAYDLALVSARLRDATAAERKEMKLDGGKAMKAARSKFLAGRGTRNLVNSRTSKVRTVPRDLLGADEDFGEFQLEDMAF